LLIFFNSIQLLNLLNLKEGEFMKIVGKVLLTLLAVLILGIVGILGLLGYIPGLSSLLGANKPRDLGITYTQEDYTSARAKSQLVYEELPAETPVALSIQHSGSRTVGTSWDSAEMTSLLNDRPYRFWPIFDVQLRIHNDGTAELSGIVIKEKLKGYAMGIGVPEQATKTIVNLLPSEAPFYVKAKTSLVENKVGDFDIQAVSLGRMPIPVNTLLAKLANLTRQIVKPVFAENIVTELSKYEGKRAAIINFINERLGKITGFYAKKAYFSDGKLYFDGTLSEKEITVR